jgi:hypothetical protein
VAIGAQDGFGELQLASLEPAASMHALGTSGVFDEKVVMRTGIGVMTIDSLSATAAVPTLMKIDVDGGEDAVLAGATTTLHNARLRSILAEFHWLAPNPPRVQVVLLHHGVDAHRAAEVDVVGAIGATNPSSAPASRSKRSESCTRGGGGEVAERDLREGVKCDDFVAASGSSFFPFRRLMERVDRRKLS